MNVRDKRKEKIFKNDTKKNFGSFFGIVHLGYMY